MQKIKIYYLFFAFISIKSLFILSKPHSKKSEWELLELWIAEWLNKKLLLLVNNNFKNDYYLIYWLNTEVIYYKNITEIDKLLTNYLIWK